MDAPVTGRDAIEDIEIQLLLEAVYKRYHYDFRYYARASVKRRLLQARQQLGFASISGMQESILHDPAMLPRLLNYLTVQVSEMFRDPSYFRALREQVLPHLRTYPSLKVWVAGCSNGEELYSLAILFREEGLDQRTIFYATDINPEALKVAQAGVYPLDQIRNFTQNHQKSGARSSLSDYYRADYGRAAFDAGLRERVVFSDHSLVTDAVFAEMHLISCRNVLIYFDRDLQDRAIGLFRESLARKGFLGLGSKESLRFSRHADAFTDFIREEKIYRRNET
ncbi:MULTISPECIES: CheR family methyltransferase [Sphingobium]|uniref:Chemotaxis protein CheR n=1 Tax=Sphingobium baderi LL03 TaxID=1114964 RepID=T0GWR8_9SPHN|nr:MULTISPECIES: CheR family methyltransferase [Sphingobium]EQB05142.1 chemotaxis protein CheR [Sphingobium baderi LL03]KMS58945.1 chemotaxis protein CheR [Sphingobium baderi LL03]